MPKATRKTTTSNKTKRVAPDLIFAAIESHRKAYKAYSALSHALGRQERGAPSKHPGESEQAWHERIGLASLDRDHERAAEAENRAAMQMARTKPSTVAGAQALLNWTITGPMGLVTFGTLNWHETALRNVVASLVKMARGAGQPYWRLSGTPVAKVGRAA